MNFNIISNLTEKFDTNKFNAYNHVVTYELRKELQRRGHTVHLVRDHDNRQPPQCDHTIAVSNVGMSKIRSNSHYRKQIRKSTKGKLCLWLDSDVGNWPDYDLVFCVNLSHNRNPRKFRYVGWAAGPERFKSAQQQKTAFIDAYMWGWYQGRYDHIYETLREVTESLDISTIQLVIEYNKIRRATWNEMTEAFTKSHYYICTQIGNWGLTNIEAATCGALLVIHRDLDRPKTWPSPLNHKLWSTAEELREILTEPVDVQANRSKAMKNSWQKVVNRIMEALA